MDEVEALVRTLLGPAAAGRRGERLSYRDAFRRELGLDPFGATLAELQQAAAPLGYAPSAHATRDEWLELLIGARVGPRLGRGALTFVHGYPASQAALARLDPQDPRTAQRFELYCDGVELANGFHELAAAAEQRARFEADNAERRRRGLPEGALDERLLAALAAGLPDCAGVALGFDRTADARHGGRPHRRGAGVSDRARLRSSIQREMSIWPQRPATGRPLSDNRVSAPERPAPMSYAATRYDFRDKHADYARLAQELAALLAGERDLIANAANTSALLFDALPEVNWAGFYFLRDGELVVGPFQGKPACVRIALGRGVCGTAAAERRTLVVPDVHKFPGHIACDAASRSEIVVPLIAAGTLLGVLDIDSPRPGRFDDSRRARARGLAAQFVAAADRAPR